MSNAACSGIAKHARAIAVKVIDDDGCVSYLSPRSLPVRVLLSIGPVNGPMCALLFHKALVFWTDIHIPNSLSGMQWVGQDASFTGRPAVATLNFQSARSDIVNHAVVTLVELAGVTLVVPAGNDNVNAADYSPASEPDAITVGATTIADAKADFSNWGEFVNIYAPGTQELMSRSPKLSHLFTQELILSLPG